MLGALENIACLRARAIIDDKFTEPILFFAASNELDDWSVLDMAPIIDMVLGAFDAGVQVREGEGKGGEGARARARVTLARACHPNHTPTLIRGTTPDTPTESR